MYKPSFQITTTILNAISEISQIKTVVDKSRVLPLNEAQLRRQAMARMVHTSTSIEGNKLEEFQVDKVLSGIKVNGDEKSIIEVKNYQQALKEVENYSQTSKNISMNQILTLHGLLMKNLLPADKTGHFRPGDIYIVDDLGNGTEKLRYEGPPSKKVPFLINELLHWLSSPDTAQLHPVLKAGIFHTQFVHIHPFSDGNGRGTRLLTTQILYTSGWDFRKIIVPEDFYNRDRQGYYNALAENWPKKYEEGVDITPWIEYFVTGLLVEARRVNEEIASIGFANPENSDKPIYLDKDEIKIMDFLTTTGQMTSSDIQDILHVAKRTAQLKLQKLTHKGLIIQKGKGPSSYYTLKA
jgi:Fic family protein